MRRPRLTNPAFPGLSSPAQKKQCPADPAAALRYSSLQLYSSDSSSVGVRFKYILVLDNRGDHRMTTTQRVDFDEVRASVKMDSLIDYLALTGLRKRSDRQ